ncbi:hypothetical protein F5Y06DRAFT_299067 [Hypoxylon sp. FL0890]|nr:hypothetical protein F5Y06DRAFT_299067 [Hypoxylon sp. FL0890]
MVPALEGESSFAATGTCLAATAGRWYVASGGVNPGRIFRSRDGCHWNVSDASIAGGEASGVFSGQFRDAKYGIAVGPTGSDLTLDGLWNWRGFDNGSFDSVECVKGPVCWASGENGRIARLAVARIFECRENHRCP